MFYFSKALSNIELFLEFFFEILNERCEPLIAVIEAFKSLLRLREYKQLIDKENINAYIDIDAYKELKRIKEIKDSHFFLVRSKKQLPKIKQFKVSQKLTDLKSKQLSLQDKEGLAILGSLNDGPSLDQKALLEYNSDTEAEAILHLQRKHKQSVLRCFLNFIKPIFTSLSNMTNRYHLDDILYILRPFIYVYSVMKYGRKSYTPVKISFMLDVVAIMVSIRRLSKASNSCQA